jgi:protein SCO1/2
MRLATPAKVLVALIAALSVAVAAAGWLRLRADAKQTEHFVALGNGAYVLAAAEPVAPFRLVAHDGAPFEDAALKGRWTFLFFGFTHCPDACPATLGAFVEVQRRLRSDPALAGDVRFVLVTVDPERDTPQALARYLAGFDAGFVGLTGDAAEIARLSAPMGVAYEKLASATGQGYHMDHSSSVLLLDPQARLHGILAAPHSAPAMMEAFLAIRKRAGEPRSAAKVPA